MIFENIYFIRSIEETLSLAEIELGLKGKWMIK